MSADAHPFESSEPLDGEIVPVEARGATPLDVPIDAIKAVRDDLLPPQGERTESQQAHIDNGKNLLVVGAGLLAAGVVSIAVGGAL